MIERVREEGRGAVRKREDLEGGLQREGCRLKGGHLYMEKG